MALYELMGGRRSRSAPPAEPPREESASGGSKWLSPGRTFRVPVGYLLLGAAGVVTALVAVYVLGYTRGRQFARAEFDRDWPALAQPLMRVPPPEERPALEHRPDDGASPREPEPAAAVPGGWGPVESDPRIPGRNYFVLIHTRRDAAVQLAGFCRDSGLEAYVIPAENVSLYRVIVLPGYEKGRRASDEVRGLERRIVDVAHKWRLQVNPRDDLAYYPERFDG